MSFESKEHYWIIVREPSDGDFNYGSDTRLYWGSKNGWAAWTADMAQATHFKTLGAARGKMAGRNAKYRAAVWHHVAPNDKVYVGEVETVATITEVKNLNAFKGWLKNAHANNRKFEEISEATK